ncbi:Proteasome subunit [Fragilaria crotonensis]|nr:Proteasome subunit [Fragilaria crotonensis]
MAQGQDPTSMNGGSCLAMAGNGCVVLAVDKRFGSGPQMVNVVPRKVMMPPDSQVMVAFTGLEGDIQSLMQELQIQVESKTSRGTLLLSSSSKISDTRLQRRKHRSISPRAMACLTSHVLYSRRASPYYVEPLVVGMDEDTQEPFLCAHDVIGAQSQSKAFVCAGVATMSMYGIAEALWRPNLDAEELVQVCGKAFLSALERDCLSGYGAILYLMTKDGMIQEIELACRND